MSDIVKHILINLFWDRLSQFLPPLSQRKLFFSNLMLGWVIVFPISRGNILIYIPIQGSLLESALAQCLKSLFLWLSYNSASVWHYNSTPENSNCGSSRISLGLQGQSYLIHYRYTIAGTSSCSSGVEKWGIHIRQIPVYIEFQEKLIS